MTVRTFNTTSYGSWFGSAFLGGAVGDSSGLNLVTSRIAYVDPASPLGTLVEMSLNTAYTVGQKCLVWEEGSNYLHVVKGYAECVTAGTTGGSYNNIFPTYHISGMRYTNGTAVFAFRMFSSWDRAFAGYSGTTGSPHLALHVSDDINATVPAFTTVPTFVVASTAVYNTDTSTPLFMPHDEGSLDTQFYPNRRNHLEGIVISASKAAWPATTYAAGATWRYTSVGAGTAQGPYEYMTAWAGEQTTFRGVTCAYTSSAETTWQEYGYGGNFNSSTSSGITFYDCTFSSAGRDGDHASGQDVWAIMAGQRHVTRCTIASTATTGYPFALVGGAFDPGQGGGIPGLPPDMTPEGLASSFDACTYTRTQSTSTAPIFAHLQFYNAAQYTNPYITKDSVYIFGGDCSGIQGYLTGICRVDDPTFVYYDQGGKLVTFGVKAHANSYPPLNTDEIQPTHWLTADGTTLISEVKGYDFVAPDTVTTYFNRKVIKDTAVYRTGGGSDGANTFSMRGTLHAAMAPRILYEYTFYNKKTDGSYLITHELQFSNTAGSGITGLNIDDVVMTVIYPCSPTTQETDFAVSSPHPRKGLVPDLTPAALPTSTAAWTGTITNPVKHKVSTRINPRNKGPVIVQIEFMLTPKTLSLLNVQTLTFYLDPVPVLSA